MSRQPRTTMSELQRALSRARLPHLELVKLVGRGYFLKNTSNRDSFWTVLHPQACTELMPARVMLTYLTALARGAWVGRAERTMQLTGVPPVAVDKMFDKTGGAQ